MISKASASVPQFMTFTRNAHIAPLAHIVPLVRSNSPAVVDHIGSASFAHICIDIDQFISMKKVDIRDESWICIEMKFIDTDINWRINDIYPFKTIHANGHTTIAIFSRIRIQDFNLREACSWHNYMGPNILSYMKSKDTGFGKFVDDKPTIKSTDIEHDALPLFTGLGLVGVSLLFTLLSK